jgi:ADP-ribose pyrophosphatase YjhB (NUDIX family)
LAKRDSRFVGHKDSICYNTHMKTKILVIGVIEKEGKVLMRKKPEGAPPYKETWYLFGGELTPGITPEQAIAEQVKKQTNLDIKITTKLSWDTEVKHDLDWWTV